MSGKLANMAVAQGRSLPSLVCGLLSVRWQIHRPFTLEGRASAVSDREWKDRHEHMRALAASRLLRALDGVFA